MFERKGKWGGELGKSENRSPPSLPFPPTGNGDEAKQHLVIIRVSPLNGKSCPATESLIEISRMASLGSICSIQTYFYASPKGKR